MDQDQLNANPTARKLLLPLGLVLGTGFALAGLWLLLLGFEVGEVYPPYSSLRADADGTEVLYEAVERVGSIRAERNYLPLAQTRLTPKTTLVLAGVTPTSWESMTKTDASALRAIVEKGTRVVLAFDSSTRRPKFQDRKQPEPKTKPKTRRAEKRPEKRVAEEAFGLRFRPDDRTPLPKEAEAGEPPSKAHGAEGTALPQTIPWPRRSRLEAMDSSWEVLLTLDGGNAVALARHLGEGRLIVLADSYLLTNEAMWKTRQTAFLIWLMDGAAKVVFDESHLGVSDQPGLTNLVARYRLHGVLVAVLFVFALFVWRNSCPLVPLSARPLDDRQAGPAESGTGLAALVRRSIPENRILALAVQEWRKTSRVDEDTFAQIEKMAVQAGSESVLKRDLVQAYGQIQDELSRRGFRGSKKEE